jgi:hypothetical protein
VGVAGRGVGGTTVGGTGVTVGGSGVLVSGTAVGVAGTGVLVGGIAVGVAVAVAVDTLTAGAVGETSNAICDARADWIPSSSEAFLSGGNRIPMTIRKTKDATTAVGVHRHFEPPRVQLQYLVRPRLISIHI